MQSIYRFRQADVGLFLQLQSQGLPNVQLTPLTLHANFRSTAPVVDWVNRVFPRVFAPANDAEQGAIAYTASRPATGRDDGGVHVHPSFADDDATEAREVIQVIREALGRDDASTIAVLVSARTHVAQLSRELANAGVDYQAVEIELLRERPVVQDLIALTRALLHLADRTAWLSVLRAPWCGLSLEDLHALVGSDRTSTIRALLEQRLAGSSPQPRGEAQRGRARKAAVAERQLTLALSAAADAELSEEGRERALKTYSVLEAALAERGRVRLRDWIERAWNALLGAAALERPQDLDDAEAFFRRLEQLETAGDLDDIATLEARLDRLFAQPRAEGPARVELMTIHKAKGLEFDVVILPALQRRVRGEKPELLRWARIASAHAGIVLAPVKADGAPADPIYAWIEHLEAVRNEYERTRLLYVAATRAKRELHLFGAARLETEAGATTVKPPSSGTMLDMLWSEAEPAFLAAAREQERATSVTSVVSRNDMLRRLPRGWQAPPPDPAVRTTAAPATIELQQPEFDWVSEVSRHVGTLVHRELDRSARRLQTPTSAALRDELPRLRAELAELGVPPDRSGDAAQRVVTAIANTYADPRGRWLLGLDGRVRDARNEFAVSGFVGDEIVNCVIDRTLVDDQGVRWIIDFKTSTHEGGGLEGFLEQEVERYRPQLARYAQVLTLYRPGAKVRAALYFPLLREWREVAV
jgi:ATP-dependent exoDNAse (exonuclease V) beta subunit